MASQSAPARPRDPALCDSGARNLKLPGERKKPSASKGGVGGGGGCKEDRLIGWFRGRGAQILTAAALGSTPEWRGEGWPANFPFPITAFYSFKLPSLSKQYGCYAVGHGCYASIPP